MHRVNPFLVRLFFAALACHAFGSGSAWSQWTPSDRERLAAQLETAAANLDSSRFPTVPQSSADVIESMNDAEAFFARQADPSIGAGWVAYLKLAPLRDLIESDASATDVARQAIDLRFRLIGTAPGLELSRLVKLRHDLERLIESVRLRDAERAETLVARQMESLAEKVRQMGESPSAEEVSTIGAVIGLLDSADQAPDLVQSFRNQFGRANLVLLIDESMVQSAINRGVHQSRPVSDCILGTRIIGNATLNGTITADLVPSIGEVRIQVALTGCVSSRNVGYNGPVILRTSAIGNVNVSRVLHIRETGITADNAYVQASLSTNIDSIEHRLRLVRRIARKKAAQQKPNADRIALEKLRSQVGTQFVEQTDSATSVTPPDVMANVRPVLTRLSLEESPRTLGSTDQQIYIDSAFRRRDQLASVVTRPAMLASYDAAAQIHESFVDNAMSPVLAGRTMREGDVEKWIAQTGLEIPKRHESLNEPLPILDEVDLTTIDEEDEQEPFEIDFARLRPIIFEARDQVVRVGVRGTRFAQGRRELKQAMEISAVYEPARAPDGQVLLLRNGEVDVSFPGPGKRLTVTQVGLKRTIQKKFDNVFPAVLLDQTFTVPVTSKLESLRGQRFRPSSVQADNGWLSVGISQLN